jgi:sugar-specific transcriptional regulator TrmB
MYMKYPTEIIKGLEAFGLDQKEVSIYLSGLEAGRSTVLELSRRTKMPRSTLYPLLEKLVSRGVFRLVKEKKTSKYLAESPETLERMFHDREEAFIRAIPSLQALNETSFAGPGVTFYEGSDGFKRLWKQLYRSGATEYRLITSGVSLLDYVKEPYILKQVIAERLERGIFSKQLIRDSRDARKIVAKDKEELRESRLLPKDVQLPATVIIFADQVGFITTRKENTMILLASGDVALTYKALFDLIWDKADTLSS